VTRPSHDLTGVALRVWHSTPLTEVRRLFA
jgi:hypothetical protein